MNFPIFNADFFGNRMVVAMIAVTHVWINHAFAVGMYPLVTSMEWIGFRKNKPEWDLLAKKITFVLFIVTTTVGALTGVGIWFVTSVVNPYAIGSLLRVFYWAWFTEWLVFVSEVVLILFYFLTWDRLTGARKIIHLRIGVLLSVLSWGTMAIIVAILGFMMNPGDWLYRHDLLTGFTNPIYVPQLLFRTSIALAMAGSLALAFVPAYTKKGTDLRRSATRLCSAWTMFWLLPTLVTGLVYYRVIPRGMDANLPVAFGTLAYQNQFGHLVEMTFATVAIVALFTLWGAFRPDKVNLMIWIVPVIIFTGLLAYFERAREFIRKPYIIGYYMYANGIRVGDVPYLDKTGVLANSEWVAHHKVTPENKIAAGKDVFMLLCSRCHTMNGVNSITGALSMLYPNQAKWDPNSIETFIKNIHGARPFMPPFIGTPAERGALAAFLATLKTTRNVPPPTAVASKDGNQ